MTDKRLVLLGLFLFIFTSLPLHADVTLPRLLGDNAILQHSQRLTLYGSADPGESVSVALDGKTLGKAKADKHGDWQFKLAPQKPGNTPHTLTFSGKNQIQLHNVLFGDVWLASGQSNMDNRMNRQHDQHPEEFLKTQPLIRQFLVPRAYDFKRERKDYDNGEWLEANPDNLDQFTSVGYYFAENIQRDENIPVGIINCAMGGATTEGWMSEKALKQFPDILHVALSYRDDKYLAGLIADDSKASKAWQKNVDDNDPGMSAQHPWSAAQVSTSDWNSFFIPGDWVDSNDKALNGSAWFKRDFTLPARYAEKSGEISMGRIIDADTVYINGVQVGSTGYQYPPRRYQVPAGVLKAGKNNITVRLISNSGVGGFVMDKPYWLKVGDWSLDLSGEWKAHAGTISPPTQPSKFVSYTRPLGFHNYMLGPLYNTKIKGVLWYQGESNVGRAEEEKKLFPALVADWREFFNDKKLPFLYVQLPNYLPAKDEPSESDWAEFREAQRESQSIPNTAMVTIIDLGDWNDIHPQNKSPVGYRLSLAARKLVYGEKDIVASGPSFNCMTVKDNKLELQFDNIGNGLSSKGKKLQGFAMKGKDGKYHWVDAAISGDTVVLNRYDDAPVSVRYAWADNPDTANLYNAEGLPAGPFESSTMCKNKH